MTAIPFPADRRVRHVLPLLQDDQVAVTHQGQTVIYDGPSDLHAAVLVANRDLLTQAETAFGRRRARARIGRYTRALRRRRMAAQLRRIEQARRAVLAWATLAATCAVGLYVLAI
jgi:hypothetical protein